MAESNPELILIYWVTLGNQLGVENILSWAERKLAKAEGKEKELLEHKEKEETGLLERKEKEEKERQEREDRIEERNLKKLQLEVEAAKANWRRG